MACVGKMRRIIDFFDRAYIINLEDRVDRKLGVEKEFQKIGIEIPDDKIQFYTSTRPTEQGDFPSLGARGSFTSHRDVLELALSNSLKNVLVFEDDVGFNKFNDRDVENILGKLSEETWDIIYFGYEKPADLNLDGPLADWKQDTIGGQFYGVNQPFIEKMAQYMHDCETRPVGHPDGCPTFRDGAYNHIRYLEPEIRVLLSVPNLAGQRSSRTDLHPLKFYDRLKWMRPVVDGIRAIKNGR